VLIIVALPSIGLDVSDASPQPIKSVSKRQSASAGRAEDSKQSNVFRKTNHDLGRQCETYDQFTPQLASRST
jgi:hypothetical protein